jgi:TolB-like protein/pimeloyl-ACP methyl ester carboxylesterase/DNA-binding SARP family transcriptional activator/Tfp pilus assembly protein PilF
MAPARLTLRLLGDIEVARGGERLSLPASKKTRALLAYLALTGKPHRRERLCQMFWDVPDDPRGALRWSLSKLRGLVDEPGRARIVAERDSVALDASDIEVDAALARRRLAEGGDTLSAETLGEIAALFQGEFLEGLELPNCPEFEAWRAAEREEARGLHRTLLGMLLARLADQPLEALRHARTLTAIEPYSADSHVSLLRLLIAADRGREAAEQFSASRRVLAEASERSARELDAAWQALRRSERAAAEAPADGSPPAASPPQRRAALRRSQTVRFCTAPDGVRIAYSAVGHGPPLVKAANWLNHLEFDWESPIWRHWIDELSHDRTLVRYDERGNGLSDWNVEDISFPAFLRDFEAVVDALELKRFALLGISQGGAVSIAYAVKYPERVSHLILYGSYAKGWERRASADEVARRRAMLTLTKEGWGQANPAFRQVFSQLFVPGASPQEMEWVNELQRISTSPENAARLQSAFSMIDVADLLPKLTVPTLVLHCRDDAFVPFEAGAALAKRIPHAKFVTLDSRNHILLEHEPAWARFVDEVRQFLGTESPARAAPAKAAVAPRTAAAALSAARGPTGAAASPSATGGERPTIAVLPFANVGGTAGDDYFGRGISDEIAAELARFADLIVIAPSTTAQVKDKAAAAPEIAKRLSANYLLDGVVQRADQRVRISAQLLDGSSGANVWTERFDRRIDDILAVQDEITRTVAASLSLRLRDAGLQRSLKKRTRDLTAYDLLLRARRYTGVLSAEEHARARDMLEEAVRRDPDFADAHAALVYVYVGEHSHGHNPKPGSLERALATGRRALELDPRNPRAHAALALTHYFRGDDAIFVSEAERALALNPSDPEMIGTLGAYFVYSGDYERGLALLNESMRLNPLHPTWYHYSFVVAHVVRGEYEAALARLALVDMQDFHWTLVLKSAVLGLNGADAEAAQVYRQFRARYPDFDIAEYLRRWIRSEDYIQRILEGIAAAERAAEPGALTTF